jgi:hypothetical protein
MIPTAYIMAMRADQRLTSCVQRLCLFSFSELQSLTEKECELPSYVAYICINVYTCIHNMLTHTYGFNCLFSLLAALYFWHECGGIFHDISSDLICD